MHIGDSSEDYKAESHVVARHYKSETHSQRQKTCFFQQRSWKINTITHWTAWSSTVASMSRRVQYTQKRLKRQEWKQITKCLTVKSSPINVGYMINKIWLINQGKYLGPGTTPLINQSHGHDIRLSHKLCWGLSNTNLSSSWLSIYKLLALGLDWSQCPWDLEGEHHSVCLESLAVQQGCSLIVQMWALFWCMSWHMHLHKVPYVFQLFFQPVFCSP